MEMQISTGTMENNAKSSYETKNGSVIESSNPNTAFRFREYWIVISDIFAPPSRL